MNKKLIGLVVLEHADIIYIHEQKPRDIIQLYHAIVTILVHKKSKVPITNSTTSTIKKFKPPMCDECSTFPGQQIAISEHDTDNFLITCGSCSPPNYRILKIFD